jgi:uncharacterized protein YukE
MTFSSNDTSFKKPSKKWGTPDQSSQSPQSESWTGESVNKFKDKYNVQESDKEIPQEPSVERAWGSASKSNPSAPVEDRLKTAKLSKPDYDSPENRRQRARAKRDEGTISNIQGKIDRTDQAIARAQADIEKYGNTFAGRSAKRDLERLQKEKKRFEGLRQDSMNIDNPEYKKDEKSQAKSSRLQRQIDQSNRNITRLQAKLDKYAREGWEEDFGPVKLTRKNLALEQKKLEGLQEKLGGSQGDFGEEEMAPESMSFSEAKERWSVLGYDFDDPTIPEGWSTRYK